METLWKISGLIMREYIFHYHNYLDMESDIRRKHLVGLRMESRRKTENMFFLTINEESDYGILRSI